MECPHIPIIPYHKFSKRIHDKAVSERIPLAGSIEPTLRCNLKCAHCYVAYDHTKKEMTYEEVCHILDEITEAGCLWLLITGGEPFVREDFLDIYTYAKKKGLIITLFTNGTLITPEIADYLKEWPPFSIEITLYGITKETYERVTGVSGSLQRCLRGINLLLERKIPLTLKTMVMTLNKDELWEIKKYVEDLGLEFTFDPILNPRLDGSKEPCHLRITPEEVVKLDLADKKRVKAYKELCENFWGPPGTNKLYACGGGLISFHIDSYANLSLCILSRSPNYNLRKGSFQKGWYDFIPKVRAQKLKGEYKCDKCELYSLCGQCPGWAQLENGDPEMPVEYLCQIAHLRAEAFEINKEQNIIV
ncbi:MAG: radical SAM protein [candidate division WOR-3 bacterium]|nr:radical SAM protein [candidate division WOR-3 bacterium]